VFVSSGTPPVRSPFILLCLAGLRCSPQSLTVYPSPLCPCPSDPRSIPVSSRLHVSTTTHFVFSVLNFNSIALSPLYIQQSLAGPNHFSPLPISPLLSPCLSRPTRNTYTSVLDCAACVNSQLAFPCWHEGSSHGHRELYSTSSP
jgi:hypothetical protein